MTANLKDIDILISEGLFEEAEKRLILYLSENPRDEKAIKNLAAVEKHLYLNKQLEVRIPTKEEALEELRRIARLADQELPTHVDDFRAWLASAPETSLVDLSVMLGAAGWNDLWSEELEQRAVSVVDRASLAEAYGWIARFYLDDGQALRARQWTEKALTEIMLGGIEAKKDLWKQLKILHARCLWDSGEHHQALAKMQDLSKQMPQDQEVRWILERFNQET